MKAKIHSVEYYEALAKLACENANNVMQDHAGNIDLQLHAIDFAEWSLTLLDAARGNYAN